MKVVLTGATGFIGSHVLADLHKHGHEVTALVREDAQADGIAARGATPAVADTISGLLVCAATNSGAAIVARPLPSAEVVLAAHSFANRDPSASATSSDATFAHPHGPVIRRVSSRRIVGRYRRYDTGNGPR